MSNESTQSDKKVKTKGQSFTKKVLMYLRYHTGRAATKNVSPFSAAAKVLEKRGFVRNEGTSDKEFCRANIHEIAAHQQAKRRAAKKASTPTSVQPVVTPMSPEWARWVASPEFLQSYEWRKLRMQAIKKYGARCQCCGSTPADGIVINVDHIKPRKKYPHLALELSNTQCLCNPCNHGKGNWDETDWRGSSAESGS